MYALKSENGRLGILLTKQTDYSKYLAQKLGEANSKIKKYKFDGVEEILNSEYPIDFSVTDT